MEYPIRYKHPSLLQTFINNGFKKFYNIGPKKECYETFCRTISIFCSVSWCVLSYQIYFEQSNIFYLKLWSSTTNEFNISRLLFDLQILDKGWYACQIQITHCYYAECHLCWVSQVSPFLLIVIMLNAIKLSVVLLNVVAPM
jgi:hypothetical protein